MNACADTMFDQAMNSDIHLQNGEHRGFLHGIPVSFKDQIIIKDTLSTLGVCDLTDAQYTNDGTIVELIKKHGGIPFVKSNTPQLLGMPESLNRVYGNAQNPYNQDRVAGGSSGGEGALIAANCSPIGIGTDAAGSIRIPCSFCGVYGFKPTLKRMTRTGVQENCKWCKSEGKEDITGTTGPIGHCIDDLVEIMKIFLSDDLYKLDITIPPMPFSLDSYDLIQSDPSKLRL